MKKLLPNQTRFSCRAKGLTASVLVLTLSAISANAQWTQLGDSPGINASTMLLLTDGRVLCHDANDVNWKILTPDSFGSYVNGGWSDAAPMTTKRLYYSSAVLADGRVFVAGGEYTGGTTSDDIVEYNRAQVYDPVADTWTAEVVPLGWAKIGDGAGVTLDDGRFLFGNANDNQVAIFDPFQPWGAGAFIMAASKGDNSSEESWVKLSDGTAFTAQCNNHPGAERYLPASDQWIAMANTPTLNGLDLVEDASSEIGPAFLLPDGRVLQIGCTGHNALFVPGPTSVDMGSWIQGPDFPQSGGMNQGSKDGPGSWMPNGDVLVTVGPVDGVKDNYLTGVNFYRYTPGGVDGPGTLTPEMAPGNAPNINFKGRMLLLPTGQVLYTGQSDDVYAYTPTGSPDPDWKPRIIGFPGKVEPSQTYSLFGTQFNGVSSGAAYGDDAEMDSNYPLVRIRNHASGHVFYCRTHDHSTMAVATGDATVSTYFDTPAGLESGKADLIVVANGIPSDPIVVNGPALAWNPEDDLQFGTVCPGDTKYLMLELFNVGAEDLTINNLERVSGSPEFTVLPNPKVPLVISPDSHVDFTIAYTPTVVGPASADIRITSNDPNNPTVDLPANGNGGKGTIWVTGSTDFGDLCAGVLAEKTIHICNVASFCDLNVIGVAFNPGCNDFELVNSPFPHTVSHDSCLDVTIRFTPKSCGPKSCTLVIESDDPDNPVIILPVTANTPCNAIDVAPNQCFPPTVIQSVGACVSTLPFPILNKGTCPVKITEITTTGPYSLVALPSFPILLQPGHTVGDGALEIAFAPTDLSRDNLGTVSVTYETDPITHDTFTQSRTLNGEGVLTGARVLVTAGGVPLDKVDKIMIQRITANRNRPRLDSVDNAMRLDLVTPSATAPCGSFSYHREYGTVSNPIQLLPGSYQVTVMASVNGRKAMKTVGFDVDTCTFNPNIVIDLP